MAFGETFQGRRLAVVFKFEDDPELVLVNPVSAYPVRRRGGVIDV